MKTVVIYNSSKETYPMEKLRAYTQQEKGLTTYLPQ